MRILIAIYSPPEYYPPLLNAINELSQYAEKIIIVTRSIKVTAWQYPANVSVIRVGKERTMEEIFSMNQLKKAFHFVSYINELRSVNKRIKMQVWQANDSIPLFAFYLLKLTSFYTPKIFWYHNHDISNLSMYGKYSVGWWSAFFEKKMMRNLQLFTIPAKDRLSQFEYNSEKIKTIVVPNFPSLKYFNKPDHVQDLSNGILKLFYQGSLSLHHGFEELIPCLGRVNDELKLSLTIIGPVAKDYKEHLLALAESQKKTDYFTILPPVPYAELKKITQQHHVGLAIHKPIGSIYSTAGTASNKIYEYAANGLPVILHDNLHYRKYLSNYDWAFFTDCSSESIKKEVTRIAFNYRELAAKARRDFENELNFERVFSPVNEYLKNCMIK